MSVGTSGGESAWPDLRKGEQRQDGISNPSSGVRNKAAFLAPPAAILEGVTLSMIVGRIWSGGGDSAAGSLTGAGTLDNMTHGVIRPC